LTAYIESPEARDPRVQAVDRHLQRGCAVCVLEARRLEEILREEPGEARILPVRPDWILPRRVAVAATGVRGMALADQQLFFEAGPFEVDIYVRECPGPPELELVGRITCAGDRDEPVAGLGLHLLDAASGAAVVDTATDEFGEFDLFAAKDGTFGLRLGETDAAPCVLVWQGLRVLPDPSGIQWD